MDASRSAIHLAGRLAGTILVAAALGALSAVLARLVSDRSAARLAALTKASRSLAAGDMSARVPDLGAPELAEVADAFNQMAAELEASRTREREFILGLGHDLRTPLTTIRGYAEALELGRISPEDMEQIGAVLAVQGRQLSRLVEDLSTLVRLDQAEFGLDPEPVDVGAHVAEIAWAFRPRADEVGIDLEIVAEEGIVIDADPERLGQIAQNLIENALRHTPEAGVVTVRVAGTGRGALIEVTDTGSGIAPEDLPHIFDRHFVAGQGTVRKEGSGLGLSIVEGLVDRMGGEVTARSELGAGTTITVRFPR